MIEKDLDADRGTVTEAWDFVRVPLPVIENCVLGKPML